MFIRLNGPESWEELKHRLMSDRAAELKDYAAKGRMQKKLTKIEKLWKATRAPPKKEKKKKNKPPKTPTPDLTPPTTRLTATALTAQSIRQR